MEWIAALLGIACVALAAVRSVWTFPTAIGSVVLIGVLVFQARLYSDALLQAFFVAANLYGWARWRDARAQAGEIPVKRMATRSRVRWAIGIVVATLVWGAAMHRWTDASYPWWDAGIAMTSVAAQVLMARRAIEHWALWIAVDVASIPLYLAKGLNALAALYVVYLALAIWGLIVWRRAGGRMHATGMAAA